MICSKLLRFTPMLGGCKFHFTRLKTVPRPKDFYNILKGKKINQFQIHQSTVRCQGSKAIILQSVSLVDILN